MYEITFDPDEPVEAINSPETILATGQPHSKPRRSRTHKHGATGDHGSTPDTDDGFDDRRVCSSTARLPRAGTSESNANGRFLVSPRFCDAEENADGRFLVSARFCDAYANGRIAFFGIDFCDSYANGRISFFAIDFCDSYAGGRIDFVGVDWKCE